MEKQNQKSFLAHIGLEKEMECANENADDFILYNKQKFRHLSVKGPARSKQQNEFDHLYGMSDVNMMHIESGLRFSFTVHESYYSETWKIASMYVYAKNKSNEVKRFIITDGDFENKVFFSTSIEIPFVDVIKN